MGCGRQAALGYANWLAGQGNPLGEYLRLECELGHLDRSSVDYYTVDARRARLAYEASDWTNTLMAQWSDERHAALKGTVPAASFSARMRKGMLEELTIDDIAMFLAYYPEIFDLAPLIRRLTVEGATDSTALQQLLRSPPLGRIRELRLSACELDKAALTAWASGNCLQLQHLQFDDCKVHADALASLLHLGSFPRLKSLTLWRVEFIDGADHREDGRVLRALTQAPACPSLLTIDFHRCPFFGPLAIREFIQGSRAEQLQSISLDTANVDIPDVEALLSAKFTRLKKLFFNGGRHRGVRLNLGNVPALEELTLMDMELDDQAASDVARSSPQSLKALSLKGGTLSTVEPLATSPRLRSLRFLDLGDNRIPSQGASALARSSVLRNLVALKLGWNLVDAQGARQIAESQNSRSLRYLHLGDNKIGDDGALALAASRNLRQLNWLNLDSNELTAAGVLSLLNSPHLGNLNALRVDDFHTDEATTGRFAERFGNYHYIARYGFYGRLI